MTEKHKANFSHFIISRFNLRNFNETYNSEYEEWINWTRERIELFKNYCLPSVLNQSTQNFKWLVFFDQDTPEEFHGFMQKLEQHANIEVCLSKGAAEFYKHYMKEVKARLPDDQEWVITSRMDNDDCVHEDMVKVIQENARLRHGYMLSLASGYTLDLDSLLMSHYFYPKSPFLALVESSRKELVGVYVKRHSKWPQLKFQLFKEIITEWFASDKRMTRFLLKQPLWVQMVHGNNVANSFYRGVPVLSKKPMNAFGLDFWTKPNLLVQLPKYFNYVLWKQYFKCFVARLVIRK